MALEPKFDFDRHGEGCFMLHPLEDDTIMCPYCGEHFNVVIDCSVSDQQYIEDCEVCCRPIEFHVVVNDTDNYELSVYTENE